MGLGGIRTVLLPVFQQELWSLQRESRQPDHCDGQPWQRGQHQESDDPHHQGNGQQSSSSWSKNCGHSLGQSRTVSRMERVYQSDVSSYYLNESKFETET